MENIKCNVPKPLTLTRERLMEIANDLRKNGICSDYDVHSDYWFICISPSGEIIKPDKEINGHPGLAKNVIFPKSPVLRELYIYFICDDSKPTAHGFIRSCLNTILPKSQFLKRLYRIFLPVNSDYARGNEILMSYFMVFFGFFNIDGYYDKGEEVIECRYNPKACTLKTMALPESMKEYTYFCSTIDPEESDKAGIALSAVVPFFKNRIFDLLKQHHLEEKDFSLPLKILNISRTEFFEQLEQEYMKFCTGREID